MKLASPDMIPKIDKYAKDVLKIEPVELMKRSAEAVKAQIAEIYPEAELMLILAGKGNNGGDGYALSAIADVPKTVICDVFFAGQRTDEGKFWLETANKKGTEIVGACEKRLYDLINRADIIVDAIFGTGFSGQPPKELEAVALAVNNSSAFKIAIDLPLGVNPEDGSLNEPCIYADVTVSLSYPKPGQLSYPARSCVGKLVFSDLGLPRELIEREFEFNSYFVDCDEAKRLLPKRKINSNKGSFGKTLLITGSDKYRGAAHLSLEASLRGGAGIVNFAGSGDLCRELRMKYPEAIYHPDLLYDKESILSIAQKSSSVLVGSGSDMSQELCDLVTSLVLNTDKQLILDADALNSLAKYSSPEIFLRAKTKPIITPHPLELSRLSGVSVAEIESSRLGFAKDFAERYNCILLLKGAATIVTDGKSTYINGSGCSALAKGGSGDALAGLIASVAAFTSSAVGAAALAAYVHGRAGENLSAKLSSFGVTPSDLPREMASVLSELEKNI